MKKILLGTACLVAVAAAGFGGYTYYENQRTMDPWLKANIAALASIEDIGQGESMPGKICYYKGTSTYADYIPCVADYPNIGKCGTRVNGYYSKDNAQCFE